MAKTLSTFGFTGQDEAEYVAPPNGALKWFSLFISVLFHPVFILIYGLLLHVAANPYKFKSVSLAQFVQNNAGLLISGSMMVAGLPLLSIFLMQRLQLIKSIHAHQRSDRVGIYIVMGLFYVWYYYNLHQLHIFPRNYQTFVLGATLAVWLGFVFNLFQKVSAHTIAMGGLVFISFSIYLSSVSSFWLILPPLSILCAGLVGSSRLYLNAHTTDEVLNGYMIGFSCQLVATILLKYL